MARFVADAEALGWAVFGYEADHRAVPHEIGDDMASPAFIWWREQEQARNLWQLVRVSKRTLWYWFGAVGATC